MISVVLPVSNEAPLVVAGLEAVMAWLDGLEWELVLLDLGSHDGSTELVSGFEGYRNVKVLLEEQPLGKGYGHRLGSLVAQGDPILLADLGRPLHARPLGDDLERLERNALLLYTPLHPEGRGATWRSRLRARLLRRVFRPGGGRTPLDPEGSVPLLRREAALALFTHASSGSRVPAFELVQRAILAGLAWDELPADGTGWAEPGVAESFLAAGVAWRLARRLALPAEAGLEE